MIRTGGFERSALFSVFIVAAFFLVFVGGGAVYLFLEMQETVEERKNELTGIGRLKVEQLSNWRHERESDARFVLKSPKVARNIRVMASAPARPSDPPPTMDWMQNMYDDGQYSAINVVTKGGRHLVSMPPHLSKPSHLQTKGFAKALRSRTIVFDDFERFASDEVRLHVFVPILDPDDPKASEPFAIVIFEIDPTAKLYELTRKWPVPSSTAEVILFRVERDSVVYLNETIHQVLRPVLDRIPVSAPDLPAAWGGARKRRRRRRDRLSRPRSSCVCCAGARISLVCRCQGRPGRGLARSWRTEDTHCDRRRDGSSSRDRFRCDSAI